MCDFRRRSRFAVPVVSWNPDWQCVAAGEGVGFVREIKPIRQVILNLIEETYDAIEAMQLGSAS